MVFKVHVTNGSTYDKIFSFRDFREAVKYAATCEGIYQRNVVITNDDEKLLYKTGSNNLIAFTVNGTADFSQNLGDLLEHCRYADDIVQVEQHIHFFTVHIVPSIPNEEEDAQGYRIINYKTKKDVDWSKNGF